MMVRLCIRLVDRALVSRLVHATRYEPVEVDLAKGLMAFDVPYGQVEVVLDGLRQAGTGRFLAYFLPCP